MWSHQVCFYLLNTQMDAMHTYFVDLGRAFSFLNFRLAIQPPDWALEILKKPRFHFSLSFFFAGPIFTNAIKPCNSKFSMPDSKIHQNPVDQYR